MTRVYTFDGRRSPPSQSHTGAEGIIAATTSSTTTPPSHIPLDTLQDMAREFLLDTIDDSIKTN
jgi:hypothetical protein